MADDAPITQTDHQEYLDDRVHAKDHFALHPHDLINLSLEALKEGKRPGSDEYLKAGKIEPDAFIRSLNAPNIPALKASERFNRLGQTLLDAHHRGVIDINKTGEPPALPPSGGQQPPPMQRPPQDLRDRAEYAVQQGILDPRKAYNIPMPTMGDFFKPGAMGNINAQSAVARELMMAAAHGQLPTQSMGKFIQPAVPGYQSAVPHTQLDPSGGAPQVTPGGQVAPQSAQIFGQNITPSEEAAWRNIRLNPEQAATMAEKYHDPLVTPEEIQQTLATENGVPLDQVPKPERALPRSVMRSMISGYGALTREKAREANKATEDAKYKETDKERQENKQLERDEQRYRTNVARMTHESMAEERNMKRDDATFRSDRRSLAAVVGLAPMLTTDAQGQMTGFNPAAYQTKQANIQEYVKKADLRAEQAKKAGKTRLAQMWTEEADLHRGQLAKNETGATGITLYNQLRAQGMGKEEAAKKAGVKLK